MGRNAVLPMLLAAAAALSACRPLVMTPEARQVAIAADSTAVGGCKMRGEVFALAPFRTRDEPVNQLKIRAEGIGADTLVISREDLGQSARKDWKAKAYRCSSRELARGPGASDAIAARRTSDSTALAPPPR